jgi:hypothetical protein
VQTIRSLAPLIVAQGTATAEEVAQGGYLEELTEQARRLEAMLYIQDLAAAWARAVDAPEFLVTASFDAAGGRSPSSPDV